MSIKKIEAFKIHYHDKNRQRARKNENPYYIKGTYSKWKPNWTVLARNGRFIARGEYTVKSTSPKYREYHLDVKEDKPFKLKHVNDASEEYITKLKKGHDVDILAVSAIPRRPTARRSVYFDLYGNGVFITDSNYDYSELKLLILEQKDKERRKFEKLRNKYNEAQNEVKRRRDRIAQSVRIAVWRRDEGKCTRCGSRESLEYDHIIPVSRGGK